MDPPPAMPSPSSVPTIRGRRESFGDAAAIEDESADEAAVESRSSGWMDAMSDSALAGRTPAGDIDAGLTLAVELPVETVLGAPALPAINGEPDMASSLGLKDDMPEKNHLHSSADKRRLAPFAASRMNSLWQRNTSCAERTFSLKQRSTERLFPPPSPPPSADERFPESASATTTPSSSKS